MIIFSVFRVVLRDTHHVRLGQLRRAVLCLPGLYHPERDISAHLLAGDAVGFGKLADAVVRGFNHFLRSSFAFSASS